MEESLKQKTKFRFEKNFDIPTRQTYLVRPHKVLSAFCCLVLVICLIATFALKTQMGEFGLFPSLIASCMVPLSAYFFSLVVRSRPLYEIDSNGITDYGTLGAGFGLIKWRNIENVRSYVHKNSVSLLIKVDNLDELLERRHLLMRPLLWVNSKLFAILGGEISLNVSCTDTSLSRVFEEVSEFSKASGRDVVGPRPGFLRELCTQLNFTVVILLLMGVVAVGGFVLYERLLPVIPPSLEVLGGYTSNYESTFDGGKQAWVDDISVVNYGGTAKGVRVELSGTGLNSGFLKNPKVLLECNGDDSSSYVTMNSRSVLSLKQEQKNVWVGSSVDASIPHKDGTMVDAVNLFLPNRRSVLKESIGWWSDTTNPKMKVGVFADTPLKGSGDLTVKVSPLQSPDRSVSQTVHVRSSSSSWHHRPLLSVGVPTDYPVTLYPDGQILTLSTDELRFDSASKPEKIAQYYKDELQNRGWKPSLKQEKTSSEIVLTGRKGIKGISIKIEKVENHTPVSIISI